MPSGIRARSALVALMLVVGASSAPRPDRPPEAPGPNRLAQADLNVFTASRQASASLDVDADGLLLAVWASRRQESGTYGVFGRLVDRLGRPLGDELHVNQAMSGHQAAPAVAFGVGGDAWVVWTSTEPAGAGNAIVGRRFGRTGSVFGARGEEWVLNSAAAARRSHPAVAVSGPRALAVWTSNTGGAQTIVARLFDAEGAAVTAEFRLDGGEGAGRRPDLPVVASQPDGGFVVAWASRAADGTPLGIRARRLDASGSSPGEVIEVARGEIGDAIEPAIDSDGRGRFVVAWMEASAGGGYSVRAQRFDANGAAAGDRIPIADPGHAWLSGAAVAMAADGRFAVAWNVEARSATGAAGSSGVRSNVLAQRFTAAGRRLGAPFPVNAPDDGRQTLAIGSSARRLVWTDAERIAAVWNGDTGVDATGVGVSLHGPPVVAAGETDLRVDAGILVRSWPLGHDRGAVVAPVRDAAWVPPLPDEVALSAGPDEGFIGFQTTGWDPADADIAVGPDHLVVVVNQAIRFYGTDGTLTLDQGLSGPGGFWESVGAGDFVFDPVVLHDRFSGRFILAATERLGSNSSLLCLAVSDDADPNGAWHRYRYDLSRVGGNIDFPNLGVGPDAVYVTTDFFDPPRGNWTHIFSKQAMLDGDDAPVRSVRNHTDVRGHASVKTYDPDAPAQYFATPYVSDSFIQLVAITDPLGQPVRRTFNLNVPAFSNPPDAEQRGSTNRPDTIDRRIKHGVYRDGRLWLSHAIGQDDTARIRWYEIVMNGWPDGGDPVLRQVGTLDLGPGVHNWFAAIDVDGDGNLAMAFNQSSSEQYISVERTYRLAGDPPGTLRPPTRLQISVSPELGDRWGDYSGLEQDPVEPSVFWSHTMYRTAGWRTWVGRFDILESVCPADVDGSGAVGFPDLLAVLVAWGPCRACPEDQDGNGDVGFADVLAVLSAWGRCG